MERRAPFGGSGCDGLGRENAQPNLAHGGGGSRFPSPARRAASPSRALLDVKARLLRYSERQQEPEQASTDGTADCGSLPHVPRCEYQVRACA